MATLALQVGLYAAMCLPYFFTKSEYKQLLLVKYSESICVKKIMRTCPDFCVERKVKVGTVVPCCCIRNSQF
jgi:hypothetical protein